MFVSKLSFLLSKNTITKNFCHKKTQSESVLYYADELRLVELAKQVIVIIFTQSYIFKTKLFLLG